MRQGSIYHRYQELQDVLRLSRQSESEAVTSAAKNKGSRFEREIVEYLRLCGFRAERTRAGWVDDRGDISGVDGFTWECKNQKATDLAGWVRELEAECVNAGTELGAVIHKKRGVADPGSQYATLPLRMLVVLLRRAGIE